MNLKVDQVAAVGVLHSHTPSTTVGVLHSHDHQSQTMGGGLHAHHAPQVMGHALHMHAPQIMGGGLHAHHASQPMSSGHDGLPQQLISTLMPMDMDSYYAEYNIIYG